MPISDRARYPDLGVTSDQRLPHHDLLKLERQSSALFAPASVRPLSRCFLAHQGRGPIPIRAVAAAGPIPTLAVAAGPIPTQAATGPIPTQGGGATKPGPTKTGGPTKPQRGPRSSPI